MTSSVPAFLFFCNDCCLPCCPRLPCKLSTESPVHQADCEFDSEIPQRNPCHTRSGCNSFQSFSMIGGAIGNEITDEKSSGRSIPVVHCARNQHRHLPVIRVEQLHALFSLKKTSSLN